jgi:hypothetical protein
MEKIFWGTKMTTYTITAEFHIDIDADYNDMLNFVESVMPNTSGVYFVKLKEIEQD